MQSDFGVDGSENDNPSTAAFGNDNISDTVVTGSSTMVSNYEDGSESIEDVDLGDISQIDMSWLRILIWPERLW